MTGDFSRLTFDPRKHYSAVLHQQGRLGLDADGNEAAEIHLHRLRAEATDVIGGCGRPVHAPGFRVAIRTQDGADDAVTLSPGRFYAGGLLCELEARSPGPAETDLTAQPDWPVPDAASWAATFGGSPPWPGFSAQAAAGSRVLFYLEAFTLHVSALVDEARRDDLLATFGPPVRERALGGADTTTRLKTVARVRPFPVGTEIDDCESACQALEAARPPSSSGTLAVTVNAIPPVPKPCAMPQEGGYSGAEYRTYRVEIHEPGDAGTATFKWSTENAAFAVRIRVDPALRLKAVAQNTDIPVLSIGDDQVTRLARDQWVEVCGEETELGVFRNPVARVLDDPVEQPDGIWLIRLSEDVVQPTAPFLRRWSGPPRAVTTGTPSPLDDDSGLSVDFGPATAPASFFHAQDYWIWSANPGTRDIEPAEIRSPQPPRGPDRHYCCLALYDWATADGRATATLVAVCPHDFPPLTELPTGREAGCCTFTVHDGVTSTGTFNSIAAAVKAIPKAGATLCILPGEHRIDEPIPVAQDGVVIKACGPAARIVAPAGAFVFRGSRDSAVTGLHFAIAKQPAVLASGVEDFLIRDNVVEISGGAPVPAFQVAGTAIEFLGNRVSGRPGDDIDRESTGIRVLPESVGVAIRRNTFGPQIGLGVTLAGPFAKAEGAVRQVVIAENVFTGLGGQAIAGGGVGPGTVTDLRVERNLFLANGRDRDEAPSLLDARSRAFAPAVIELSETAEVEIRENRIEGNGPDRALSGIHVEHSRGVRVAGNAVVDNGGAVDPKRAQGGIVLVNLSGGDDNPAAMPFAGTVEGNRVSATSGPALLAIHVSGTFAVLSNQFARSGGDLTWRGIRGLQGLTVMIANPVWDLKDRAALSDLNYLPLGDEIATGRPRRPAATCRSRPTTAT